MFDHYEEILYLLRGIEEDSWPENIANGKERERYKELKQEGLELLSCLKLSE